jgi:hypothetical protein
MLAFVPESASRHAQEGNACYECNSANSEEKRAVIFFASRVKLESHGDRKRSIRRIDHHDR